MLRFVAVRTSFVASGTMGNLVSQMAHLARGQEDARQDRLAPRDLGGHVLASHRYKARDRVVFFHAIKDHFAEET